MENLRQVRSATATGDEVHVHGANLVALAFHFYHSSLSSLFYHVRSLWINRGRHGVFRGLRHWMAPYVTC